jgi:hypothetical protein
MKCLHEAAAYSVTKEGSCWFCNQNPSCNFICPEEEGYLYEKAINAWCALKSPHPCCTGHGKVAKMWVVKDLMNGTYGRPFFVCPYKLEPCSFWMWGDVH